MYRIIADKKEINAINLSEWLVEYKNSIMPKRLKLGDYYDGRNEIIKQNAVQGRPNYSINVNMAKYITDVATGYTFGKPLKSNIDNESNSKLLKTINAINAENYAEELD